MAADDDGNAHYNSNDKIKCFRSRFLLFHDQHDYAGNFESSKTPNHKPFVLMHAINKFRKVDGGALSTTKVYLNGQLWEAT